MVLSGLSGWHGCAHSCQLQQHAGTFAGTGTHNGVCHVPPTSVLESRHQYPTAILPPSWKHSGFSAASWQWLSLTFYFHKECWSNHGNWNDNKHHRHCHYMPIHLNTDLRWVSYYTMQLARKVGKPWGTNFLSHILSSQILHNNLQGCTT